MARLHTSFNQTVASTGRLSWDERFRDRGAASPGVSYHRASFPNGVTGMAMPHGAVFVR